MNNTYEQHKERLEKGYDFKRTKSFFAKNGYTLENAYCKLLDGDLKSAKQLFAKMKDYDNRASWGYKITNFLQRKFDGKPISEEEMPTFFQLRNFLEVDLNLFIIYNKGQFVEVLCGYSDVFASVNAEVYKFYSRVFHFNGYAQFAKFFGQKAKDYFYKDPELHYHLALISSAQGDISSARQSCLTCLSILSEYFPAKKMLSELRASY